MAYRAAAVCLWFVVVGIAPAAAQTRPDPRAAVSYARNAFEYRDFDKVIEVLWPWLHPPQIVDTELALEARELLGISLHIVGRTADAEEEFSALLLLSPDHSLDPFVVPPDVIQSFEAVKRTMEPTLRALRDKAPVTPQSDTQPPPTVVVEQRQVEVPHPAIAFVPFGVPQFVLGEPAWGGFWLATQAGGWVMNGSGFWLANQQDPNSSTYDVGVALQYAGLAVAVLSYIGGAIQAGSIIRAKREELLVEPAPSGDDTRVGIRW